MPVIQSMWAVANKPDVYAIELGAPGAEITAVQTFATLQFKNDKRLVDAYIKFESAPQSADFIVLIKDDTNTCATITVSSGSTISDAAVINAPDIAALSSITIDIDQTGVSPDTGINGVLMLVFAA